MGALFKFCIFFCFIVVYAALQLTKEEIECRNDLLQTRNLCVELIYKIILSRRDCDKRQLNNIYVLYCLQINNADNCWEERFRSYNDVSVNDPIEASKHLNYPIHLESFRNIGNVIAAWTDLHELDIRAGSGCKPPTDNGAFRFLIYQECQIHTYLKKILGLEPEKQIRTLGSIWTLFQQIHQVANGYGVKLHKNVEKLQAIYSTFQESYKVNEKTGPLQWKEIKRIVDRDILDGAIIYIFINFFNTHCTGSLWEALG